jgi:hypothetical protein
MELSLEEKDRLRNWISEELQSAENEHLPKIEKWEKWQELYEAKVEEGKNFPFKNCSNTFIPLTATGVEALYARITALQRLRPAWTIKPLKPDIYEIAKDYEMYLDTYAHHPAIKFYKMLDDWTMETIKLGTSIVKVTVETITDYKRNTVTGKMESYTKKRPRVEWIPRKNFRIREGFAEIEDASWVGFYKKMSWADLLKRVESGLFTQDGIDGIKRFEKAQHDKYEEARMEAEDTEVFPHAEGYYDIWEIWCEYDYNDDGKVESLIVHLEANSKAILRVQKNTYKTGKPFVKRCLMMREGRFDGIGLPEMGQHSQEEINTMHNQRIDNATLSNTVNFKATPEAAARIKSDSEIYTGKVWEVPDINSFVEFRLGETHPFTYQAEEITRRYHEQRTGISDQNLGVLAPRRVTAYTTATVLQEGNRKFDLFMRDTRRALGEVAYQITALCQQFIKEESIIVPGEEKDELKEILVKFPEGNLKEDFSFEIMASSGYVNRESERQNNITMFNIQVGYYDKMARMAALMVQPNMPQAIKEFIIKIGEGLSRNFEKIMHSFEVVDTDELIPDLRGLEDVGEEGAYGEVSPVEGSQYPMGPPQKVSG